MGFGAPLAPASAVGGELPHHGRTSSGDSEGGYRVGISPLWRSAEGGQKAGFLGFPIKMLNQGALPCLTTLLLPGWFEMLSRQPSGM